MWFDLVFWVLTTIFIAMRFYHVLRYLPTTRTQPQSIALATIGVAYLLGTIILFLDFGMQCRLMRAKDAGEEMMAEVGAPLRLAEPLLKVSENRCTRILVNVDIPIH